MKIISAIIITSWLNEYVFVIKCIRSTHRKYKLYVANRVLESFKSSEISNWHWCPGNENSADEATMSKFKNLQPNGRRLSGPSFLQHPDKELITSVEYHSEKEVKKKVSCIYFKQRRTIINFNRFSNNNRLKSTTALLFRYKSNLLRKTKGQNLILDKVITADQKGLAELYLCHEVQKDAYGKEFLELEKCGYVSIQSDILSVNPILEKGLLRAGRRLTYASCLPLESRRPIKLPKDHVVNRQMLVSYHERFHHINMATVMAKVRRTFWIPSRRQVRKSIKTACPECRLRLASPNPPKMGLY